MTEKRKCVFAGSFDPPTLGHKTLVETALQMFDEVVVAVMVNPLKTPYFTTEERKEMLALDMGDPRVKIIDFEGTVAELLKRENTKIYLRGIRNGVDLDFENANFYASRKLDPELTAVYLPCPQELLHVSSSIVRNSLHFKTPIDEYVSEKVKAYIEKRTPTKEN
ncbi:MAG: pantetheine-phosphate adenylyltransferase [Clostridiales bacterium]|nr:pantetheine-phosphate adenylyltransferase [Clostridiales bacterium]